jgi:hypothetical protein
MRLYFTGSDIILLNEFPKQLPRRKILYVWMYRLFVRISSFCVEGCSVVDEHLIPEMRRFGIKKDIVIQHSLLNHVERYPKIRHKGFNVFYYCPLGKDRVWNKWIYGFDIYQKVKQHYKGTDVNFMWSWGQFNMPETFPIIDFYLRCNRHDGDARLVRECELQRIPYYWSYENPDFESIIQTIDRCRMS